MSTPVSTSSTDSQMHNNIMAAGSKDRPPMLGPGRYSQWRSCFLRYIDTKINGEGLKKYILNGPYVPTSVLIQAVPEAEDEIYSTVDACNTANEMWIAIERLQQGESLNVQDVKTNLFWEFGKFTFYEEIDEKELEAHYSYMAKIQEVDQNAAKYVDERATLANLIANLTLDTEENKTILKQLKKANVSLTHELEKCKTNLDETNSALGEAISCRDSCLIALQNKQNEFEKYKAFNDRTIDYEILQTKLNETLGLLALKDIEIKEGLKTKAYEISVLNQKHDELVKKSLLTKSQLEGYLKENTKVISDLKVKEEKDIDKMIEMDKQLKFLNEIVYTRNQSIQTIHMLAPKCSTYNGRPTFANPRYLKKAQSEKPCLYEIPFDTSDPANRFAPDREETMTLDNESRSKLNKDYVKPYDYTKQNSLYEIIPPTRATSIFYPQSPLHLRGKEFREDNVEKTVCGTICDDMELLIKTFLMPLSIKSQNDSFRFEHELKTEMHEDYEYVKSLEKEVDELESEKADFSNMYDLLLEECVSKDVTCSYLHSLYDLNAYAELQCMYLHKVKECECLAQKLSKQTESVNNEVHNKLLKSFAKLEKHSISLELSLQHCKEQMKNNPVCKENASNVFRKEREQYHEIQDLKAQMQDKNIAISELKKLIEKCKGKSVDTKFDKPSVVRQPNAQRIPKLSVLGKPAPFSNSLERINFAKKKSVSKTNESEGLSKPVTPQNLPKTATQAVRNTNMIKPGMYRIASSTTQSRAPQLTQTSRNTNPRMSTSTCVAHRTNVSIPQPRSNQMKDKVLPNTSQVKFKKTEVEDHPRIYRISNQTKSVTESNDSLNSRTSNVNDVCATCRKCVFNLNHDSWVSKYLNDVNARTKKPKVVPISSRKPKSQANKSVATPHKKTVASESTITNSKSYYRMLYKKTNKAWKWWIAQQCPSAYTWVPKTKRKWVPKVRNESVTKTASFAIDNIVQLIIFIVDSGCTNNMTGNLSLLCNFIEKYLGTVRFGNDQFAPILGYGDLVQGNIMISRVYYVEGLNHNLFSVGQFCDADLEVAFQKSTCFVRDLQGNDLLTGNRRTDLYTISLQETTSSTPICLMAKASPTQAWLWHRRLSHLNFDYINLLSKKDVVIGLPKLKYVKDQLRSSCEVSKAKRSSFKSKTVPSSKGRLNLLHIDLCGPINLQAPVISVCTDRGTEFLNKTLNAFFKEEGIEHQTSTPRTPEQNGDVERRNRTLVKAARTMLSASKLPLFFWAEAIATACYTQNRSIIIPTHEKMAYHIINDRKPSIKHLHIFGCTCYLTRDGENLDKMKEKGDPCILVGYSTQSKGYRVYNKRTRLIVESIHLRFDEIKEMSETSVANDTSGLVPQR
ncbi:retrovirus-related pol polyprotein from transposon TNT 1-94 [Tanacetum coccineum]